MADVLIFDDDPSIASLAGDLLRKRGVTVGCFQSSDGMLQILQENRPRLVVLDLMMPGMDGLSACRAIRSNPVTRHVKVVIMTARNFLEDRESARSLGADFFLNKPFDAKAFVDAVLKELFLSEAQPPVPPVLPIRVTVLEGGAVIQAPGQWIVLDAGRGLRNWLAERKEFPKECWILLSRFHEDAFCELQAGASLLEAGCRVRLVGPDDSGAMLGFLGPRLSAAVQNRTATPLLHAQREGECSLSPYAHLTARYSHHPTLALAYRIDLFGRSIVYCPVNDVAFDLDSPRRDFEAQKFQCFFSGAHLVLHGYRRSVRDPRTSDNRGQGAWEPAVDIAAASGARHLALFPLAGAEPARGLRVRRARPASLRRREFQCSLAGPARTFQL